MFLMASKKRPKNKTSNYLISMGNKLVWKLVRVSFEHLCLYNCALFYLYFIFTDQNDLNRTGRGYLGKLRSNFVGTEFQVII